MSAPDLSGVPKRLRPRVQEICELTDALCAAHLNDEYAELARDMSAALGRQRPSLLERGEADTWAGAIVHAVG